MVTAYDGLSTKRHEDIDVTVRRSATAEDLPNAGFACIVAHQLLEGEAYAG